MAETGITTEIRRVAKKTVSRSKEDRELQQELEATAQAAEAGIKKEIHKVPREMREVYVSVLADFATREKLREMRDHGTLNIITGGQADKEELLAGGILDTVTQSLRRTLDLPTIFEGKDLKL